MQHLIYCKKCNHHTTVNHLEWTAIICQSCTAEIASQTYIDLLLEKIENRDLNLAQRDRLIVELEQRYFEALVREGDRDRLIENRDICLQRRDQRIDELETKNRALTKMLESLIGKPLHLRGQISKPCSDCNYEEWATQEDAKREVV